MPVTSCTYAYDAGTLLLDTETIVCNVDEDPNNDVSRVLDRSHDALLRPTGWALKNGSTTEHANTYTYESTAGRLSTVAVGGDTFTYGYKPQAPHLLASVGKNAAPVALSVANAWETNRDVLDARENKKSGSTLISKYDYSVNNMGRRNTVAHTGSAFAANSGWTWGYNGRGEIATAQHAITGPNTRAYETDTIGNLCKTSTGTLTLPTDPNWLSNALNQYTSINGYASITYDLDGNTTNTVFPTGPGTLTWDAQNRLAASNVTGTGVATYQYDPYGRRILKTEGGITTCFVYDGWNLIAEYTSGTLQRSHTWGLDVSGSIKGAGGVGGLLATKIGANTYYPTYDGNGNVSEYLDASGNVVAHYEYDPYGNSLTVATPGSLAGSFNIKFSTKYEDVSTKLYYYGNRLYQPLNSRWLNRDPIGEDGGVNLYAMVGNDTVNGIDMLGLIDYKFNREKCIMNVILKWKLTFNRVPERGPWFFRRNSRDWREQEKERWKKKAKEAVENYFNKQKQNCKNCNCSGGVQINFDLQYVDSGADFQVDVSYDSIRSSASTRPGPNSVGHFDRHDANPGSRQNTIVHETGHMLGLNHPGQDLTPPATPGSHDDYYADPDSLMGVGMTLRPKDFKKAFCDKIK